jgi:23S rRNA (cytosine1962-C5)-methyltransferase
LVFFKGVAIISVMKIANYPTVKLLAGREQSWLFGHPWIYSKAVAKMPKVSPGSLVTVLDHLENVIGVGVLNSKQTIALRMYDRQNVSIDHDWFYNKLKAAQAYRQMFFDGQTTAYRLCYGESDGIPGLVVDAYDKTASVQINTKGMELLLPQVLKVLPQLGYDQWVVQADSPSAKRDGVVLSPSHSKVSQQEIWALENGLKICVPLSEGQKTGWFCDQREARACIGQLVSRQRLGKILNLCSYTGGFALAALAGGCQHVLNIDQDKKALDLFEKMRVANNLPAKAESQAVDMWDYFQQSKETFDLVIADPPAFVKESAKKETGMRGYRDLFKQSVEKVSSGGFLAVFSCSHYFTDEDLCWILRQVFTECRRRFQTVQTFGQGLDHPVPVWFPESRYLKGLLLKEY